MVECTSDWYIKDGFKFGRVGFTGLVLVGYIDRHCVGRRAGELRHSLFWTANRMVGWSCITSGGVSIYRKSGRYSVKWGGVLKNGYRSCFRAGKIHRNHEFREEVKGATVRLFGVFEASL